MDKNLGKTKEIINKIIIMMIFIFVFNFVFANLGTSIVFAATGDVISDEDMEKEGGGKFLLPIHQLILFLADAVLQLLQNNFITSQPVTITATAEEMEKKNGWAIFGIIVGVVVLAVACVVTCGAAAAVAGAASAGFAAVATTLASVGGTLVGRCISRTEPLSN